MSNPKKKVYIALFMALGLVFGFLVHGIVEQGVIQWMLNDFERATQMASWHSWLLLHHGGVFFLTVGGLWIGYYSALWFWPLLYDRNGKRRK
ncbi:MAG: hypothetical protein ACI83D_000327 [Planctomycetota bacterium]|jgi:hypothetical protein